MPIIKTSTGDIHYKTQVIYLGVKQIDKKIAEENLLDLKKVLDDEGIRFMLIAGTLLGAVREHDFITHDEDIDLAFLNEDKQRVFDILPKLINIGFKIARYDKRELMSIIRNGEYIDLYFFKPKKGEHGVRTCSGWLILDKFLTRYGELNFKGEKFYVPEDYKEFLKCEYGDDWMTPVKWFDYQMPWWKLKLFALKEHIKDWLPMFIMKPLLVKVEARNETIYRKRLNRYLANGGTIN